MYDLKTILLAKRFRRNLDITHLTIADIAMLEIIKNKASGNPVRDATITNGIAYFDRVSVSQPLVSLKLNIPVTQTGSGTPSPDNIRDIIGFSGVNIGQTSGYGEYFKGLLNGTYGFVDLGSLSWTAYSLANNRTAYYTDYSLWSFSPLALRNMVTDGIVSKLDLTMIFQNRQTWGVNTMFFNPTSFTLPAKTFAIVVSNEDYVDLNAFMAAINNTFLIFELETPTTPTITPEQFATLCQAFGITGNTYEITFGQTVYSANLDVLTGKLYLTHEIKTIDENSDIDMLNEIVVLDNFFDIDEDSITDSVDCNCYQRGANRSNTSNTMTYNPDYSFCCKNGGYATRIMIKDTRFTTIEDYKTWLSTNPVKIAVKLAEPIEIQLTPTQITTLIGENVIFADVADVTECKYTRK